MNKTELKELASQLRQPQGSKGKEIGDMMNRTNITMTIAALERLPVKDGDQVLEVGPGNGGHVSRLFSETQRVKYVGLDISALMKEEAEKMNAALVESQEARFVLYDGQQIPFNESAFDAIFTVNTLYFWSEPEAFLGELYRVLKPGGTLAVSFGQKRFMEKLPFMDEQFRLYDTDDLVALVKTSSFKLKALHDHTEFIESKTGEKLQRHFSVAVLQREG